jgi:hypothetical protein
MRGHDNVCVPAARVLLQFGSKPLQELMVKPILRLLNSYEWIRIRILHEQKICEHLQRAVAHVGGVEWVLVALLVERQQQPAVSASLVLHMPDTRDAACDFSKHLLEPFGV